MQRRQKLKFLTDTIPPGVKISYNVDTASMTLTSLLSTRVYSFESKNNVNENGDVEFGLEELAPGPCFCL